MQDYQKRILKLLKEIDAICRKNAITYYCSGGTVIGAARHGGFIPWDDDIDVCMMRSDFERFCEVFRKDPPEGRFLLYNENDPDYHSTIPRYVEAGSTSFCRYHMLGEVPAGASIDIFILEAVPDDPGLQKEFIRKFFIYSDLVMPFYCFSHRVPAEHLDDYAEYRRRADEEGERAVINSLHDELFGRTAEDSEYVCLLWASSPSIFPRSVFGKSSRLTFEDAEISVPEDWYRYLVLEYGMGWKEVPYSDVQAGHITINRTDASYEPCYTVRDSLYSQEELTEIFRRRKEAAFEYEKRHRPLLEARAKIKADAVKASVGSDLASRGVTAGELLAKEGCRAVLDVFAPYLDVQLSRWLIGSRTRFHYYRYMYPLIIDIPDDWMEALTCSLLEARRFGELYRLLDICRKAGRSSAVTEKAEKLLEYYQNAESLYYNGRYEDCLKLCGDCEDERIAELTAPFRAACEAVTEPGKLIGEAEHNKEAEACANSDILCIKALGDAYYNTGSEARAKEIYAEVLGSSRNGMLWNDIKKKTGQTPDAVFCDPPYSPAFFTITEKALLDEAAGICRRHGIAYVLSPALAGLLESEDGLGYNADRKVIYMTADNAGRFVEAFEAEAPEGRALLSWKNDPDIDDLVLEYQLKDSIFVNLRDIRRTLERGIGITIRILRSGSPYSPRTLRMRSLEHMANSDSSRKRSLFENIMKHPGAAAGSEYYYYINRPGQRPLRKTVSRDTIEKTSVIRIGDMEYTAPADRKKEGKAAAGKKTLPENLFCCANLSRREFSEIAAASGLDAIDMADHDKYASLSKAADAEVDGVWESIVSKYDKEWRSES